jgi:hypothetical protein
MSKWEKISIVLAGLLILTCLTLAGTVVWWVSNTNAAYLLAGVSAQAAAVTPTEIPSSQRQSLQTAPLPATRVGRRFSWARAYGIVSVVDGSTVTVSTPGRVLREMTIGSGTHLIAFGVPDATMSDVRPKDTILAFGLQRRAVLPEPRAVIVPPENYTRANVVVGRLQSASAKSLSLASASGPLTVTLPGDVEIYGQALQSAPASDLVVARYVVSIGHPESDGTFTAQLIFSRTGGPGIR